jgi:hypothetical protein
MVAKRFGDSIWKRERNKHQRFGKMRKSLVIQPVLAAIGCAGAILAGAELDNFTVQVISLFLATNFGHKLGSDLLTLWLDGGESKHFAGAGVPDVPQLSLPLSSAAANFPFSPS